MVLKQGETRKLVKHKDLVKHFGELKILARREEIYLLI